jgi:DNA gyrase/topoisomerase IV subunit A
VAHESRHAEQHFLRASYLAGTGLLAPDVQAATGVPTPIATEAVNQKMGSSDARFTEAKTMDKAFGADGAKNRAISDQVDTEIASLDKLRADATAARSTLQASATSATVADAKTKLEALRKQTQAVEKAYLAYRSIPYEADAHEVGDSESEAFSKLP